MAIVVLAGTLFQIFRPMPGTFDKKKDKVAGELKPRAASRGGEAVSTRGTPGLVRPMFRESVTRHVWFEFTPSMVVARAHRVGARVPRGSPLARNGMCGLL